MKLCSSGEEKLLMHWVNNSPEFVAQYHEGKIPSFLLTSPQSIYSLPFILIILVPPAPISQQTFRKEIILFCLIYLDYEQTWHMLHLRSYKTHCISVHSSLCFCQEWQDPEKSFSSEWLVKSHSQLSVTKLTWARNKPLLFCKLLRFGGDYHRKLM